MAEFNIQFAVPIVLASNGTITITLNDIGPTTYVATVNAGTYWNDRDHASASNLLKACATAMDTIDVGATWAASEATGDLEGRSRLKATRSDGNLVASLAFGGGFTALGGAALLGYAAGDIAPASPGTSFTSSWQADYLWIPHGPLPYCGDAHAEIEDVVVETMGDDGSSTRDFYASKTLIPIEVRDVPGALILPGFMTSEFSVDVDGLASDDPNVSWEHFMRLWRASSGSARLWPDRDDLTTYWSLTTLVEGLASVKAVAVRTEYAPLLYDLEMTGVVAP